MNLDIAMKQTVKLAPQMLLSTDVLQMSSQGAGGISLKIWSRRIRRQNWNRRRHLQNRRSWRRPKAGIWKQRTPVKRVLTQAMDCVMPVRDGGLLGDAAVSSERAAQTGDGDKIDGSGGPASVDCLDENGHLGVVGRALCRIWNQGESVVGGPAASDAGLRRASGARSLEAFEPAARRNESDGAAIRIAERGYLRQLARRQYHAIAQSLGISQEAVLRPSGRFALEPYPGAAFVQQDLPAYVSPDVVVLPAGDGVCSGAAGYRRFTAADQQLLPFALAEQRATEAQISVLEDSAGRAGAPGRLRRHTYAAKMQRNGLCGIRRRFSNRGQLRPSVCSRRRKGLSLHASTISRTIREKYFAVRIRELFHCNFFLQGVKAERAMGIKAALAALLEADTERVQCRPKLCEQLEKQG